MNQLSENMRLHQHAAGFDCSNRQIFVDIGNGTFGCGNEALARHHFHCVQDPVIGHIVGAQLVIHHLAAGLIKVRHIGPHFDMPDYRRLLRNVH